MRLRIVQPLPTELEGIALEHLRFGASYEIPSPLFELLLIAGYGVPIEELSKVPPKRNTPKRAKG